MFLKNLFSLRISFDKFKISSVIQNKFINSEKFSTKKIFFHGSFLASLVLKDSSNIFILYGLFAVLTNENNICLVCNKSKFLHLICYLRLYFIPFIVISQNRDRMERERDRETKRERERNLDNA